MKNFLKSLYCGHENKDRLYKEENTRISNNVLALKNSLNDHERKLLLRIRDDYSLVIEKTSENSFFNGVRIGANLMLEILYHRK